MDDDSVRHFRDCEILRSQQIKSLDVMLDFFGLNRKGTDISPNENLSMERNIWLKRSGHNHLRISRIIRSLFLCSQKELAESFQSAVIELGKTKGIVSDESIVFWRSAFYLHEL